MSRNVVFKRNLIATILVIVIVIVGLAILNYTFPETMLDDNRFIVNCVAFLVLLAVLAVIWLL